MTYQYFLVVIMYIVCMYSILSIIITYGVILNPVNFCQVPSGICIIRIRIRIRILY
jgi:hypothetical protein